MPKNGVLLVLFTCCLAVDGWGFCLDLLIIVLQLAGSDSKRMPLLHCVFVKYASCREHLFSTVSDWVQ